MPVCDVCDTAIDAATGCVLTTTEVAENPAYWKYVLSHSWAYVHDTDPEGAVLPALARRQAAQDTGWLVCQSCASLFNYDRDAARARTSESLANPRTVYGPAASAANVLMAATRAWKELYPPPPKPDAAKKNPYVFTFRIPREPRAPEPAPAIPEPARVDTEMATPPAKAVPRRARLRPWIVILLVFAVLLIGIGAFCLLTGTRPLGLFAACLAFVNKIVEASLAWIERFPSWVVSLFH